MLFPTKLWGRWLARPTGAPFSLSVNPRKSKTQSLATGGSGDDKAIPLQGGAAGI